MTKGPEAPRGISKVMGAAGGMEERRVETRSEQKLQEVPAQKLSMNLWKLLENKPPSTNFPSLSWNRPHHTSEHPKPRHSALGKKQLSEGSDRVEARREGTELIKVSQGALIVPLLHRTLGVCKPGRLVYLTTSF